MPWWRSSGAAQSKIEPSSSPSSENGGMTWSKREMLRQPQLTRQRKLRHLRALDVEGLRVDVGDGTMTVGRSSSVRSSSASLTAVSTPQPLPRPEGPVLASGGSRRSGHLNSPVAKVGKREGREQVYTPVGKIGERFSAATPVGSKPIYRDGHRDFDTADACCNARNSSQDQGAFENNNTNIMQTVVPTASSPSSGFSSPLISPRKGSAGDFFSSPSMGTHGPAVWSAPEFPCRDTSGYTTQVASDMAFPGSDRSFHQSPNLKNTGTRVKNTNCIGSPLLSSMYVEATAVRALPLPPRVAVPIQSPSSLQNSAKSEIVPLANQWQKGKLIGSGTFGNVYVGTNRHTGALCAMKEVNLIPDDPKTAECTKQMEQEILVLSQLKHPNIVQYYGSEIVDDRFYIYLEYVYPGSIHKYIQEHCGAITESVVRNFTRHILNGLAYLHSKRTVHRDIKGANLLVDACGVVKLADFGMAKHLTGASSVLSMKGTPHWMAPEVIQGTANQNTGYDLAVDVWSLGCTIIEIFTGKHPWQGYEGAAAMFKVLQSSPCVPEELSHEGKEFLQQCFRRNPAERPTAGQLLEHPFVRHAQQPDLHGPLHSFPTLVSVPSPPGGDCGGQPEADQRSIASERASPSRASPSRSSPSRGPAPRRNAAATSPLAASRTRLPAAP